MAQLVRMSALLLMAVALAGCSTGVSAQLACGNWTELSGYSCLQLDDAYNVYWRGEPALNRVWIGVEVQGDNSTVPNWVGFGVSIQGGMKGAAITVIRSNASANGDRTWQLESRYSTAYAMPMSVTVPGVALQSIVTLPAQGIVRALFYRPLDACVNGSIRIEPGQPHAVIWAYGMGEFDLGHTNENRGNSFVEFVPSVLIPTPAATPTITRPIVDFNATFTDIDTSTNKNTDPVANTTTSATLSTQAKGFSNVTINTTSESIVSFLLPPHEIPTKLDTYTCYDFQVPDVDQGRQIIGTVGIENAPIAGYVHHMLLYACESMPPSLPSGRMYECRAMPGEGNCLTIAAGWAPGGQQNLFPPETGITIGPNGFKYFTLQIHYNNPTATPGIIDQSGIQLLVTSQPRKYEVGTLVLGAVGFQLPPGRPYVKLNESWCPSSCTKRFPTNLTVFGASLHAHQTGVSMSLRHIRNGQELRPIAETNYYDYRFQPSYPVAADTATIMPGDELITTCAYNTLGRTNVTTFGEGTQQEMCFAFIRYWPRMNNISACAQGQSPLASSFSVASCGSMSQFRSVISGGNTIDQNTLFRFVMDGTLSPVTKSTFTPYEMYGPQCEARVNASMAMYASQAPQPATMDATRQRLRRMLRKE